MPSPSAALCPVGLGFCDHKQWTRWYHQLTALQPEGWVLAASSTVSTGNWGADSRSIRMFHTYEVAEPAFKLESDSRTDSSLI